MGLHGLTQENVVRTFTRQLLGSSEKLPALIVLIFSCIKPPFYCIVPHGLDAHQVKSSPLIKVDTVIFRNITRRSEVAAFPTEYACAADHLKGRTGGFLVVRRKGKMSRDAATFRQHDVTRALRAVSAAGMVAARVEIDTLDGKIVIQLGTGGRVEPSNALDKWIAEHAR